MSIMSSEIEENIEILLSEANPAHLSLIYPREYEQLTGIILDELTVESDEKAISKVLTELFKDYYDLKIKKEELWRLSERIKEIIQKLA